MNHNIERAIIASLLNYELPIRLVDKTLFTDAFHRKLIDGYNRLHELNLPIDFQVLRDKFTDANYWSLHEDDRLLDIMCNTTPFASDDAFNHYYRLLDTSTKIKAREI